MGIRFNINRSISWNLEYIKVEITERFFDGPDCYPWRKVFILLPKRSIEGKWLFWEYAYKRKFWAVWGKGFHMEPHVEYATLFEVLKDDHNL